MQPFGVSYGIVLGLDVVLPSELDRIEPELVGHQVDDSLGQPQVLQARVAAVRDRRALVRDGLRVVHADVLEAVTAGRHLRPDHRAERLVVQVGAGVVEGAHLEAEDRPVAHHGHLDVQEDALVAVAGGEHVVRAVLGPLHGPAGLPRQEGEPGELRVAADLDPERPADVLRPELQPVARDAERRADHERGEHRHLVVRVDLDDVGAGVPVHHRGAALERRGGDAVEVQAVDLDHVVGVLERPVHVPVVVHAVPHDVRADLLVEDRGVGIGRGHRVHDRGQRLVLDVHQLGGVARYVARLGQHQRDGVALIADLVRRQAVLLDVSAGLGGDLEERLGELADLGAGQRGEHPVEALGLRGVDGGDPGVRHGRADEVGVPHPSLPGVVRERALALEQPPVLLPRDARAGPLAEPVDPLGGLDGRLACRPPAHFDTSSAAASIDLTTLTYPVQRQTLPRIPRRMSASEGRGLSRRRAVVDIRSPGVQ